MSILICSAGTGLQKRTPGYSRSYIETGRWTAEVIAKKKAAAKPKPAAYQKIAKKPKKTAEEKLAAEQQALIAAMISDTAADKLEEKTAAPVEQQSIARDCSMNSHLYGERT